MTQDGCINRALVIDKSNDYMVNIVADEIECGLKEIDGPRRVSIRFYKKDLVKYLAKSDFNLLRLGK